MKHLLGGAAFGSILFAFCPLRAKTEDADTLNWIKFAAYGALAAWGLLP